MSRGFHRTKRITSLGMVFAGVSGCIAVGQGMSIGRVFVAALAGFLLSTLLLMGVMGRSE